MEDAERTLKRTKELKQRELVSQSELDAAQTAYDAARSQVNVTQAQVGQAQASMNQAPIDLGYTVIRSPVDGIVISRNVDVGQTVAASLSAPTLFTIANDLTKMEVHTNVDEADVGNISRRAGCELHRRCPCAAPLPRQGASGAQRATSRSKTS